MAYLGNDLQVAFPTYRNIDDISGSFNGVTTSFPLTVAGVAPIPAPINSQQCLISVNGVVQRPDDSGTEGFRLSGGNIIFASAPAGGVDFFGVILAGADYVNIGANFPSGTAVAPSITFDSDLDTGIYNPAGNQIGFTTSGVQRLVINSSGQISGGLGTAAAPVISFISDPNTGIYSPGADQVAISTGGSGRLFVDANGNVGIADSTPQRDAGTTSLAIGDGSKSASVDLYGTVKNYAIYNGGSGQLGVFDLSASTERITLTSAGLVGVGSSSPVSVTGFGTLLTVANNAGGGIVLQDANTTLGYRNKYIASVDGEIHFGKCADDGTSPTTQVLLDHTGRLGIGTTAAQSKLTIGNGVSTNDGLSITFTGNNSTVAKFYADTDTGQILIGGTAAAYYPAFYSANSERARIDTSGRLLVGTSSESGNALLTVRGNTGSATGAGVLDLGLGTTRPGSAGTAIGYLRFTSTSNTGSNYHYAAIYAESDGTSSSDTDIPGRLVFSTTADGASSPTERMRIANSGTLFVGKQSESFSTAGFNTGTGGTVCARTDLPVLYVSRISDDGTLVSFYQGGTEEGTISVSGTTVSYNGAHLSRWSQIPGIDPHDKDQRPEILRGTVMSNLDELCDWTCPESGDSQDNEQLNKTKISDVVGDKNVAGVFQSWDDDDDTWVNDYYLAMTGDFIIRIGAGVTVERGDLLMSAGDGTAKPQDDDIIRSKTIAKVTSTNVSCTYDDGSYCVPCVLMAC